MNLITINDLLKAINETLGATFISTLLAYIVGVPLGTLLYVTGKNGICKNKVINVIFGFIVNILRSIPCLFLIVIISLTIPKTAVIRIAIFTPKPKYDAIMNINIVFNTVLTK